MISITTIHNPDFTQSVFGETSLDVKDFNGMFISEQQNALNFRHRFSKPGYCAPWHVAGDPTLIIIRSGVLRLSLQNGQHKDFLAGDMFIAKDFLPSNITFDPEVHGHRAEVIGNQDLLAVLIKLGKIPQ